MRSKSIGVKRRFTKSSKKPPSSTALRPFPLFNPDEADDDDDDFSKTSSRHNEDCNVGDCDDWMEVEACLMCNGHGQLLVCCVIDCPVSVHEKCAKFVLTFDDLGRFYCPYCSYKKRVARAKESMKKAMLAKKALSGFIDSEMVVGEASGCKERQHNAKGTEFDGVEQQAQREEGCGDDGKGVEFDGVEQQAQMEEGCGNDGEGLEFDGVEQQAQMEEGCGNDGKGVEFDGAEQQAQMEGDCRDDGKGVKFDNGEQQAQMEGYCRDDKKGVESYGAEQQAQMEGGDCRDDGKGVEFDDAEQQAQMEEDCGDNEMEDALTGAKPSKKTPRQPHTTAEKEATNQNETVNPSKKPRQRWEFPKTPRQRLRWRSDEEDMLREGVGKFAKPGQKNTPWKKILNFGRHVFDSTRTPSDLKDKWRNMSKD